MYEFSETQTHTRTRQMSASSNTLPKKGGKIGIEINNPS